MCQEEKPLTEFYKCKPRKDGLYCYCKPCARADNKKTQDQLKCKRAKQNVRLRRTYGLTPQEYIDMFVKQSYKCWTCQKQLEPYTRDACVDHCHETYQIRGILCLKCNFALGSFDDNVDALERAIEYLKTYTSSSAPRVVPSSLREKVEQKREVDRVKRKDRRARSRKRKRISKLTSELPDDAGTKEQETKVR